MASYFPYLSVEYLPDLQKSANFFISFTPLFSYGTTCYGIYKKQNLTGFSIDICATMLIASILRICYYTISPFEISLLRQSIVMIFIQCVLLKVSLKYRPSSYNPEFLTPLPPFRNELNNNLPRRLSQSSNITQHENYTSLPLDQSILQILYDLYDYVKCFIIISFVHAIKLFDVYYRRPTLFWQWSEEAKYWQFLANFTIVFAILTAIFNKSELYGACIGITGLLVESLLPLPQILLLNRLQSIKNFKIVLLLSWLGGDLTKLSYLTYGTKNISVIFILAGLFQMFLDIIIAYQYFHFKKLDDNGDFSLPFHDPNNGIELSAFPTIEPGKVPDS